MKITTVLHCLMLLLLAFLLAVVKYGYQSRYTQKNIPLFNVFDTRKYDNLRTRLQRTNHVVLVGQKADGIQQFVEDYLNRLLSRKQPYQIFWREIKSGYDVEIKKHPIFIQAYNKLRSGFRYMRQDDTAYTNLWVLNNIEGTYSTINKQLDRFFQAHSQDKLIIICRPDLHKGSRTTFMAMNLKFQILQFQRPEFKRLQKGLVKFMFNKTTLSNMANYYQHDLAKVNQVFLHDKPLRAFLGEFDQELRGLDMIMKDDNTCRLMRKLCLTGEVIADGKKYFIDPNILLQENGLFLWISTQAVYAYQLKTDSLCRTPQRFAQPLQLVEIPELKDIYSGLSKKATKGERPGRR